VTALGRVAPLPRPAPRLGGAAVYGAALAETVKSRSFQQYAEKRDACP